MEASYLEYVDTFATCKLWDSFIAINSRDNYLTQKIDLTHDCFLKKQQTTTPFVSFEAFRYTAMPGYTTLKDTQHITLKLYVEQEQQNSVL